MLLQQKINLKKNLQRVGNKERILIDIVDQKGWSLGRSYRDAPEIDNYVKINKILDVGSMYTVKINKAYEYDVEGEII